MIRLKVALQELCKPKLEWDEEVSDKLRKVWEVNLKELEEMGKTVVPRRFDDGDEKEQFVSRDLCEFNDGSKKGCEACVYVRSIIESENVHVRYLTSKSCIATLKEITIPRLELLKSFFVTR